MPSAAAFFLGVDRLGSKIWLGGLGHGKAFHVPLAGPPKVGETSFRIPILRIYPSDCKQKDRDPLKKGSNPSKKDTYDQTNGRKRESGNDDGDGNI